MGHKITTVRSDLIFVVTFDGSFDLKHDAPAVIREVHQILDNIGEPIGVIYDLRPVRFSFGDFLTAVQLATHTEINISNHPMLVKQILLIREDTQGMIAGVLKQSQRGGKPVTVVNSMEIAINQMRQALPATELHPIVDSRG